MRRGRGQRWQPPRAFAPSVEVLEDRLVLSAATPTAVGHQAPTTPSAGQPPVQAQQSAPSPAPPSSAAADARPTARGGQTAPVPILQPPFVYPAGNGGAGSSHDVTGDPTPGDDTAVVAGTGAEQRTAYPSYASPGTGVTASHSAVAAPGATGAVGVSVTTIGIVEERLFEAASALAGRPWFVAEPGPLPQAASVPPSGLSAIAETATGFFGPITAGLVVLPGRPEQSSLASGEQEERPDDTAQGVIEARESARVAADLVFAGTAQSTKSLQVGLVPIGLAALQRAADAFFARLEALADDLAGPGRGRALPWLATVVVAVGAHELGRRHSRRRGRGAPSFAPYPVLAVLSSEEWP